ncbi:MAG: hypothetical protein HQL16_01300 [Candidatus Omnitrophica bacterium]|nr:hypothetical protein [Candidatus Omnitrophota bacterium]
MSKILAAILFFFAVLFTTPPLFAQESVTVEGCNFAVQKVEFGKLKPRQHPGPGDLTAEQIDKNDDSLTFIAISYRFINSNENRKLDLKENFRFSLSDEFGNQYRQLKKPDEYARPVLFVSKNFPSIYPGETYGETLFFEAPIDQASVLKLGVEASAIGNSQPVELKIFLKGLRRLDTKKKITKPLPLPESKSLAEGPLGIKIAFPEQGHIFNPGDLIHLKVLVSGPNIPKRIIVDALEHTLEDNVPARENVYDIVIPSNQASGQISLSVIGQWPEEPTDLKVASDSILVNIRENSLLDAFN